MPALITAFTDDTQVLRDKALSGDRVVVIGTGFGNAAPGSSISLTDRATNTQHTAISPMSWTDTTIIFTMPKVTPGAYIFHLVPDTTSVNNASLDIDILYGWNGSYFNNLTFLQTGFFHDSEDNHFLFEQNYRGFFPVSLVEGVPAYLGSGDRQTLPTGTVLTSVESLAQYATPVAADVVTQRYNGFRSDPGNILGSLTQNPTTLVENALTHALASNKNLQQAVNQAAGYLTDPALNFILSDILNGWNGGADLTKTLGDIVNNHASTIHDLENRVRHLADFKAKLIHRITDEADRLRELQGEIDHTLTQNTFTTLVSAFPDVFGPIQKTLQNQHSWLSQEILKLLPGASAGFSNIISGLVNQFLGGFLPQILNPADKLLNDLENLLNNGQNILAQIPIDGFASLDDQTALVDQLANLLNFFIAKIAVTAHGAIPQPIMEISRILTDIEVYAQSKIGINTNPANDIDRIIEIARSQGALPQVPVPPSDPTDPLGGGTFANIPNINDVLGELPPVVDVPVPDVSLSPDVDIATTQNQRTNAQTKADSAGSRRRVKRGDCINNIADVPLKPRSTLLDGSTGDFVGAKKIPF